MKIRKILQKTRGVHWVVWVGLSFFVSVLLVQLLFWLLQPVLLITSDNLVVLNAIFGAISYVLILLISIGVPALVHKYDKKSLLKMLGLERGPKWMDLLKAVAAFFVYYGILFAVMIAISVILGVIGVDATGILAQEQETGFAKTGNSLPQLILIFISLVILPPICEEITMRGFLFSKLRGSLKMWPAAILTSLTFAVIHGQLNVGIDTFVLSMVLCFIRVSTGSMWSGIFVHMMKNGLAFMLLFTNIIKLW
jgi:membrane protease YdiL (CAAX protease family)